MEDRTAIDGEDLPTHERRVVTGEKGDCANQVLGIGVPLQYPARDGGLAMGRQEVGVREVAFA